jgi:hypothetical protein
VMKSRLWSLPTTELIGSVHVKVTMKVPTRMDQDATALTTESYHTIQVDYRKL